MEKDNRRFDLQQFFISANSSQENHDFDLDKFTDEYIERHPEPERKVSYEKHNVENVLHYAKRLGDYVRMHIENKDISPDNPMHIAYTDFIKEWEIYQNQLIKQNEL